MGWHCAMGSEVMGVHFRAGHSTCATLQSGTAAACQWIEARHILSLADTLWAFHMRFTRRALSHVVQMKHD